MGKLTTSWRMAIVAVSLMMLASCTFTRAVADTEPNAAACAPATISIEATEKEVAEVLADIGRKLRERVLIEKTVQGKVTLSLEDAGIEAALAACTKAVGAEWRKVYLSRQSPLLEKPESLAATVRMLSRLQFPDMVVSDSSLPVRSAHITAVPGVKAVTATVEKDEDFIRVYIITNDAAARKKEAAEEAKKSDKAKQYTDLQKESIELFKEMTPEEREKALNENLDFWFNSDPAIMSEMMQAMMNVNPETLARMNRMSMDYFVKMPAENRRAMMRFQMESMKQITPEMMQIIQEDAAALMHEMQEAGEHLPLPPMPAP